MKKSELNGLFERIRNESQLKIILEEFYGRLSQDILIGFYFHGKDIGKIVAQ